MTEATPLRRIAGVLRTPNDLRARRPLGDGVRAARSFAFDIARPFGVRTGPVGPDAPPAAVACLPDGLVPSGRGTAPERPAMPQTGALAAYAALLARKVKPPRDVPVRGLPLVVRRPQHADALRGPGSILGDLAVEDAKVAANAARATRPRAPRTGAAAPVPGAPVPPMPSRRAVPPATPARAGAPRVTR